MAKKKTKRQYKDPPRFKLIEAYEGEFIELYNKRLAKISSELIVKMTSSLKQNLKDETRPTKT